MTEVWMVRHTSVAVAPGVCYGRSDVPLRESFPQEAAAVRELLAGEVFDGVWSSPLSRCVRLARACGYADARLDARLAEIDFGQWELQRFDAIDDPQLQRWYDDYLHVRPTGGESFDEQMCRVRSFLEEVAADGCRRALLFTHGGVQLAAGILRGLFPPHEAFSHAQPYGGILKFEW